MKSLKTLVSLSALAVCMGAASMANAVSITPNPTSFTTPASTIAVSSPASLGAAVNCGINFTGSVATGGANASITGATVTGGGLCGVPVLLGLPWTLTPTGGGPTLWTGTVSGVNFNILGDCATSPVTINVTFDNATNTLSIPSAQTVGKCKITKLDVHPDPKFVIVP
ncbi:alkane oxidation protein activator PraB [Pseudomonas sp. S09G 359]|jgi:hypothetical protein|uniref:alkane oxidation protein activator PraB n=1 Tax=Pseudomonas sp. S09G 359 TaxID=2054919 RepID=UPI000C6DD85F|nr:alkane oxidation protein activator PraB [Pseudomonas sp. S09G 359]AUG08320.1 protein activator [Pseudomonas sp. S09G 359]